jgi:biopolymer transport protein TolR
MSKLKKRRHLKAEINVVPYIDVMLVLLIIFMVTAPLITQGIHVDLPQANTAKTLPPNTPTPFIISVSSSGVIYLNSNDRKTNSVDENALMLEVAVALKQDRNTPIMIRGDKRVDYGRIIHVMTLAQAAGAPSVGLITEPTSSKRK